MSSFNRAHSSYPSLLTSKSLESWYTRLKSHLLIAASLVLNRPSVQDSSVHRQFPASFSHSFWLPGSPSTTSETDQRADGKAFDGNTTWRTKAGKGKQHGLGREEEGQAQSLSTPIPAVEWAERDAALGGASQGGKARQLRSKEARTEKDRSREAYRDLTLSSGDRRAILTEPEAFV